MVEYREYRDHRIRRKWCQKFTCLCMMVLWNGCTWFAAHWLYHNETIDLGLGMFSTVLTIVIYAVHALRITILVMGTYSLFPSCIIAKHYEQLWMSLSINGYLYLCAFVAQCIQFGLGEFSQTILWYMLGDGLFTAMGICILKTRSHEEYEIIVLRTYRASNRIKELTLFFQKLPQHFHLHVNEMARIVCSYLPTIDNLANPAYAYTCYACSSTIDHRDTVCFYTSCCHVYHLECVWITVLLCGCTYCKDNQQV